VRCSVGIQTSIKPSALSRCHYCKSMAASIKELRAPAPLPRAIPGSSYGMHKVCGSAGHNQEINSCQVLKAWREGGAGVALGCISGLSMSSSWLEKQRGSTRALTGADQRSRHRPLRAAAAKKGFSRYSDIRRLTKLSISMDSISSIPALVYQIG